MKRVSVALAAIFFLLPPVVPPAFAQTARTARLVVTVADPSGAIIPNAPVTIVGLEDVTKAVTVPAVKTTAAGTATLEGLAPGRYSIQAEFPGFQPGFLKEVRLRPGDNKHLVILPLQRMETEVTVGRDLQMTASDRRDTFGSAMTREQIEALSDDPDEMARQLHDMAGPDAVLRIDSFEGGKLPPKAQIKAIHITRDSFAAENHYAGGLFIDIITQPGMGPLRAGANYMVRDRALNARNPMTATKAEERTQRFGLNIGGSLIKERSSFALSVQGNTGFTQPHLKIGTGNGQRSETLNLRVPADGLFMNGLFDYALTRDQTLRVRFYRESSSSRNLGVGGFDLEDRAFSSRDSNFNLRIQEAGPLGRRFFINTRLELNRQTSQSESALEAQTIRINDVRTFGGQQQAGGRQLHLANLASDLDYVRGIHSVRAGIVLNGGRYHTDESSNYLGTYTFESEQDFLAGRPRSYTRRIGDPNILYWNLQAGAYLQDDIRVSKTLTLSPGIRYEAQTHLNDLWNFGPRFGFTWSPFKSGKTTLRASWGIFYDWLPAGTYEQSLRVDGFRQQELNIANPFYPDPGTIGGVIPPTNRYLLDDNLPMGRNMRVSAGIDQRLTPLIRFGATYSDTRGAGLLRGRNLNPPVNGFRPDPFFGNIVEVVPDARLSTQMLSTNFGVNLSRPSPTLQTARFNWRRGGLNGGYTISRARNNTDGAFSLPATGELADEWGPSANDIRHRLSAGINSQALRNLNVFINVFATSGSPYTIRTGRDDNRDQVFNDRPAGIGRNTERGTTQFNASGYFNYTVPIGKRKVPLPPGIMITGDRGGGGLTVTQAPVQPDQPRYRLSFNLSVQNLINRTNYGGFNGTMTSPFFRQPTTASGPRKVDFGMGFSF
jgi:carboxypeptidase family protein